MEKKYTERLKFYADTPMEKNKFFCWKLESILTLKDTLWRFLDKGWHIRSAWYEKLDASNKESIENTRINLQEQISEWTDNRINQRKRYLRKT